MSWELFQQGPEVYVPIILVSLAVTVLAYGAFPFIYAKTRKAPIIKKKYKRRCYGINAAVMFLFMLFNGGVSNGAPYLLWTSVFVAWGTNILEGRNLLLENEAEEPRKKKNLSPVKQEDKVCFCRKCGAELNDAVRFCHICGTEIMKEQ